MIIKFNINKVNNYLASLYPTANNYFVSISGWEYPMLGKHLRCISIKGLQFYNKEVKYCLVLNEILLCNDDTNPFKEATDAFKIQPI